MSDKVRRLASAMHTFGRGLVRLRLTSRRPPSSSGSAAKRLATFLLRGGESWSQQLRAASRVLLPRPSSCAGALRQVRIVNIRSLRRRARVDPLAYGHNDLRPQGGEGACTKARDAPAFARIIIVAH